MINIPEMKVGIVAVSRDCFPESLSVNRRKALVDAYAAKYDSKDIYECPVCIVESEIHMVQALEDIKKAGCNALCVYLGNFGPEISETLLAKHFDGPKMFVAASEENIATLSSNRGDAYCGMLNASYNLKLRNIKAYIPEYPVGNAEECADMIHEFLPIARAVYALNNLKIISFGPRPLNFLACNAPIKPLYDLGVEIEENSELDLFESFNKHAGDERIPEVVKDMEAERARLREKIKENDSRTAKAAPKPKKKLKAAALHIGDRVRVLSLNLEGTVSTLPNPKGDLFVQMGILRSQVNINDLEYIGEAENLQKGMTTGGGKLRMSKSAAVSTEINLIGMTVDEAIAHLDKYLDDAYLAHVPSVRIVHGKGTGALRTAVHQYLKRYKHVKSFRLGTFGEGDAGVTIAEFK